MLLLCLQMVVHRTLLTENDIYMQGPSTILAIEVLWLANIDYASYYDSNLAGITVEWRFLDTRCSGRTLIALITD